jgi:hypothetical protein
MSRISAVICFRTPHAHLSCLFLSKQGDAGNMSLKSHESFLSHTIFLEATLLQGAGLGTELSEPKAMMFCRPDNPGEAFESLFQSCGKARQLSPRAG